MNDNAHTIEKLTNSKMYQDYERAFTETARMPVTLRPVESWQLPHHGRRGESPFCSLMAQKSRSCAACLQTQEKLSQAAQREAASITCPHGLTDTAVPVRAGERTIGFLQTGQVFRAKPTEARFERAGKLVAVGGGSAGRQEQNAELLVVTNAKEFIRQNQAENLSLGQVAKAVNTSSFYFCKLFKKTTGLNFTNYVSRVRIEKAKNLLLNPNLRISEIAFEVGFQSLTHFNRVFKKIIGQAPTEYRAQIQGA